MSTQTKLIKNSRTVKFPKVSKSVKSAFERAICASKGQKWVKVVIVGYGKTQGNFVTNNLDTHEIIGMLEDTKYLIHQDTYG